jgi:two-component system, OmpR family, sensor histidine kinase KdpD
MSTGTTPRPTRVWHGYVYAAVVAVAPAAVVMVAPVPIERSQLMLLLMIAVAIAARVWGSGPGVLAAAVSFLALAATGEPRFADLRPAEFHRWAEVVTYIGATGFLAFEVGRLREEQERAKVAETDALALAHLSAALVPDVPVLEAAADAAVTIRALTGASWAGVIGPSEHGVPTVVAQSTADGAASDLGTREVVRYAWDHRSAVGLRSERPGFEAEWLPSSVSHEVATGSRRRRTDIALPMIGSDGRLGGLIYVGPASSGKPYPERIVDQLVLIGTRLSLFGERQRLKSEVAHAQATSEAEQLRASLMSSLSHELKTPIASMSATISGLLDEHEPTQERLREELLAVDADLARLDRSIGELLDLSRLETDEWRPAKDWHDLGDVVGSVVGSLPDRDRTRVVLDLPEEPVLAFVDFVQVSRAVHHVVENALAYSDAGERVVVSVVHSGGGAVVSVTDRGPGVPVEERTRVFDKFYRGAAAARVPHGTGLGLAISSEIVARHGGALRVESARPRGARFVLEFPDGATSDPVAARPAKEYE